ncbi:MAG: hypothetical protein R3E96_01625 [Planctomycetota bacterium]
MEGRIAGHDPVASERDLEGTAGHGATDGGHGAGRQLFDRIEDRVQLEADLAEDLGIADRADAFDVRAGEVLIGLAAREHHAADRGSAAELIDRGLEVAHERRVEYGETAVRRIEHDHG